MLVVETIARIRREHFGRGKSIKAIARDLRLSRKVVRKVLRSGATEFTYERREQPHPKLGPVIGPLGALPAVDAVFLGKERAFNRRFLQLCSHYLVKPVACTPAAGWEKGQVENQVGFARDNIFKPLLRFKTLEELNGWLEAECRRWAETHRHPELRGRTVAEVFEAERPALVPVGAPFDGCREVEAVASSTCLVSFDRNRYSVAAVAARRPVQVRAYADRIVIRCDGAVVGEHARQFGSHGVRSLALPAGPGAQAWGAAQRGTVSGLAAAAGARADPPPARER